MQRLHYTGQSFFVADDICDAVLHYASALADAGLSDVIGIPMIDEAGVSGEAEILIGPASQLYSTRVEHMHENGANTELVQDLRRRAARVKSGRPPTETADEASD